jgi:hypothetical protein
MTLSVASRKVLANGNVVAFTQQMVGQVGADKADPTGNQYTLMFHPHTSKDVI